jgi:hypothetical protein
MDRDEYISLDALAGRLGLPRSYLREQAVCGAIPCLRLARRIFFDEASVREALRALAAKRKRKVRHA